MNNSPRVVNRPDWITPFVRLLFVVSLLYLLYSLLVYGWFQSWQDQGFLLIQKLRMFPPFADLRWITATSECGVDLGDLSIGKAFGCDPYGRGGIEYPPMSIIIARLLGVEGSHTGLIGLSTGLALVGLFWAQLRQMVPSSWKRDLVGAVIMLGFPVQLALERGNVDIVLFLMMVSLAAALASKRLWVLPICLALSFVLVAVKIYPFVGLFAWVGFALLARTKVEPAKYAVLMGAVLGCASFLPWYLGHAGVLPNPDNPLISHGFFGVPQYSFVRQVASSWPRFSRFGLETALFLIKLFLFAIPLVASIRLNMAVHFRRFLDARFDVYTSGFFRVFIELTGLTWLACYFLVGSYDYRMIYAFPGWIGCVALYFHLRQGGPSPIGKLLMIQISLMPLIFIPGILEFSFIPPFLGGVPKCIAFFSGLFVLPYSAGMLAGLLILVPDWIRRLPAYKAFEKLPSPI